MFRPLLFSLGVLGLVTGLTLPVFAHDRETLSPDQIEIISAPTLPATTDQTLTPQATLPPRELFGFSETTVGTDGVQAWNGTLSVTIPPRANPRVLDSLVLEPATNTLDIQVSGHTALVRPLGGLQKDQTYTLGLPVRGLCPIALEVGSCSVPAVSWLYKLQFHTTSNFAYPLGTSSEGRAIWAHTFGRCKTNNCRKIMLTGAVHGSEWRSGDLGRLIGILDTNPHYLARQDKEILIIPQVNPDGVARGSRYTASGVNLNRNFPAAWEPCAQCGTRPISEIETLLVVNATNQFDPDYLISYHAQWPPDGIIFRGSDTHPDTIDFANFAAARTGYPVGYFPDFDTVPGDQTVWAESRGTRSLIIEATYVSAYDWDKNWPLYTALLSPSF